MTPKNIHKIFIPPKYLFFPKKYLFFWIKIQSFEPQKMDQDYLYMKISEYPLGPSPLYFY